MRAGINQNPYEWPTALVIFSSLGGTEWDFCWRIENRHGPMLRRLCLERDLFAPYELARHLYALRAYDLKTDEPLADAQLAANVERMLRAAPPQRRLRRLRRSSPLFREAGRWELLNFAAERALRAQYKEGEPHPARDGLVYSNLRLVMAVARRFGSRELGFEDLVQEGCRGLIRAADLFDPDRGFRFSTYASWWIRQSITRAIAEKASLVRVPVHLAGAVVRCRRIRADTLASRGVAPTPEQLARKMKLGPERWEAVRRALAARSPTSLLPPGCTLSEPGDASDPYAAAWRRERDGVIDGFLSQLDRRTAKVVRWRFGLGGGPAMTLQEIGDRLKLTRERVRQIEAKAINWLKHHKRTRILKDFVHVDTRHYR